MKITALLLAALLSLTACVLVPDNRGDGGSSPQSRGDDRGHERDREHCDHDGHCDQRHD